MGVALSQVSKPEWLRFGFPRMCDTDVLEISGILTGLGCCDPRMQEAIDLILSKQDNQGRWSLENTFKGWMLVNIGWAKPLAITVRYTQRVKKAFTASN